MGFRSDGFMGGAKRAADKDPYLASLLLNHL